MLRRLWERLTQPDRLSISVDVGGVTFQAEGDQNYVITAYTLFLQQLNDADVEDAQEAHLHQLPHFRSKTLIRH